MKEFTLKCISGSLKGKTWTFQEGKYYQLGRSKDAEISIPDAEVTVSSQNTFFTVRNGVPYIGNRKVHATQNVGTWLNDTYLAEVAEEKNLRNGWYPLYNDDTIAIGYGGTAMQFSFSCPDREFSIEEARTILKKEIASFEGRRPYRMQKGADWNRISADQNWMHANQDRVSADQDQLLPPSILREVKEGVKAGGRIRKSGEREDDRKAELWKDVKESFWNKEDLERVFGDLLEKRVRLEKPQTLDEMEKKEVSKQIVQNLHDRDAWAKQWELKRSRWQKQSVRLEPWETSAFEADEDFAAEKMRNTANASDFGKEKNRKAWEQEAVSQKKDYKGDFSFKMQKKIGEGGFSNVYLAVDQRDETNFVIKAMDVVKDPTARQKAMYFREADLGERLNHKNLVKTYDIRIVKDSYCILMEYCNGGTIADRMKEFYGYLDLEEATSYFFQVLDALDYLHNVEIEQKDKDGVLHSVKGIVHRDIKPANMLISVEDGKEIVKLSDFGLSKSYELAGYSGITQGGGAASLKYCSKRQFSNYQYVGPQDDVFSAVASYYEMITGKCVRDTHKYVDINRAIWAGSLLPVREANPQIPRALAKVIDSVLQEEAIPADSNFEFTTAKELKRKIKDALS